jgi:hypothetical protein
MIRRHLFRGVSCKAHAMFRHAPGVATGIIFFLDNRTKVL